MILQAISNPSNEELQDVAWKSVMPLVGQLKKFYEYATELGKGVHRLDLRPKLLFNWL